jgi:hypothetical protein
MARSETNAKTLICKISKGHGDHSSPSRPPLGRGGRCAWVLKVRDQSACEIAERKKTRQDDLARATASGGVHRHCPCRTHAQENMHMNGHNKPWDLQSSPPCCGERPTCDSTRVWVRGIHCAENTRCGRNTHCKRGRP